MGFLGAFVKFRKASSLLPPVCLNGKLGSHWTGFHDIWYLSIFRNSVKKIQDSFKSVKNKGHFTLSQYTFLIIPRSLLLKMKNISDESSRENQNTQFMFNNFFFPLLNRAVYEKVWENVVERGRTQMPIWSVRVACWMPRASDTHSGCVILIALVLQQWMHENAPILRHTCIANLVKHIRGFLSFLFYFSKFECTVNRRI